MSVSGDKASETQDIGSRAISAFKWSVFFRFSGQIVLWSMTFYTIRLLEPHHYGVFAVAAAFTGLMLLINEGGLNTAVVQAKEVSRDELRKIFGFVLLVSIGLFALTAASGAPLAGFFDMPELTLLVPFLGLQVIVTAMGSMSQAMLVRQIRLKEKSRNEFYGGVLGGAVTLSLASAGYGVWSIAIGNMSGLALRNLLNVLTAREFLSPSFNLAGIGAHVKFGLYITGQRIIWYLYTNADTFIIGRLLNETVLGVYSVGRHVANLPVEKVGAILNEVLLSSFSRIQDDAEKKAEYFIRGLRGILTIAVPTFFGIALIAEEAVPLVLGDKWIEAIVVVQILALVAPLKIVNSMLFMIANSQGKPHVTFFNTLLGLFLIPPAILIGAKWELVGICTAWTIVLPITTLLAVYNCLSYTEASLVEFLKSLLAPAISALAMVIVTHESIVYFMDDFGDVYKLILKIMIGVISYTVFSAILNLQGLKELWRLLPGSK